ALTTAVAMLVLSAVTAAMALSGCRVAGEDSAGSPRWVAKPMPSGFSGARAWAANVTWPRNGLLRTGVPAILAKGAQYPSVGAGLVAVAGDVVVVAAFTASTGPTPEVWTLQFRNARTGEVVVSKTLGVWDFSWIRADTVDGKAVVEARYSPL